VTLLLVRQKSPYRCAEAYITRHFIELYFYVSTAKLSSVEELTASISHGHNSTDFSITQNFRSNFSSQDVEVFCVYYQTIAPVYQRNTLTSFDCYFTPIFRKNKIVTTIPFKITLIFVSTVHWHSNGILSLYFTIYSLKKLCANAVYVSFGTNWRFLKMVVNNRRNM
jgi:hypothetical protein